MSEHEHTASAGLGAMTLSGFLGALGAKEPAPGGGAAAAVAGATAASLGEMVARYSVKPKSRPDDVEPLRVSVERLVKVRNALVHLADDDASAYAALQEAQREAKGAAAGSDEAQRHAAAARRAAEVPLAILATALAALRELEEVLPRVNRYLVSDLAIAADFAGAAARAASWNVQANVPTLRSLGIEEGASDESDRLVRDAERRAEAVGRGCRELAESPDR